MSRNTLPEKRLKIFVCGSMNVTDLTQEIKDFFARLDVDQCEFLIGDCRGVDAMIQNIANNRNIMTTIYAAGNQPRVYVNPSWPLKLIVTKQTGRKFYEAKDVAMCNDCDCMIAIWDGKSKGTKRNIDDCIAQDKIVKIFRI